MVHIQILKREVKKIMKTYSSKDFYLSSFLMANACNLLDTLVEDGITTFVFELDDEVKKLIGNYYSLKSRVEPMAYGQAIRTLKNVIHASKSNSKSNYKNERYTQCAAVI
ncbi:MAG TPA: hypothetical protein DHV28_06245 [Ignavibacteriales bacterium]|nr:hypothetical protein [Ignavibacteriales bacterium]